MPTPSYSLPASNLEALGVAAYILGSSAVDVYKLCDEIVQRYRSSKSASPSSSSSGAASSTTPGGFYSLIFQLAFNFLYLSSPLKGRGPAGTSTPNATNDNLTSWFYPDLCFLRTATSALICSWGGGKPFLSFGTTLKLWIGFRLARGFLRRVLYCVTTPCGFPICRLIPDHDNATHYLQFTTATRTASGETYGKNARMPKFPPNFRRAWKVVYFSPKSLLGAMLSCVSPVAKFRHKKTTIFTWHGSTIASLTSIAAYGFENRIGLGKLFGAGIYQSSIADTALYYCRQYYQVEHQRPQARSNSNSGNQSGPPYNNPPGCYLVLLSCSTYDTSKSITDLKQQDLPLTVDAHLVCHVAHQRPGSAAYKPARKDRPWWDLKRWLPSSWTGLEVSGDEVVMRDESSILPYALVELEAE